MDIPFVLAGRHQAEAVAADAVVAAAVVVAGRRQPLPSGCSTPVAVCSTPPIAPVSLPIVGPVLQAAGPVPVVPVVGVVVGPAAGGPAPAGPLGRHTAAGSSWPRLELERHQ